MMISKHAAAVATAVLSAGLSLGFVATAATALADTSSSSTMTITDSSGSVMGSTVTADTTITVKDVVKNSSVERQTYTITAVDPDGNSTVIGSKDIDPGHQNTVTGTLKTVAFPNSAEAPNGDYTFTSSGTGDTGQTTLQIAPAAVSGVTATATKSAFSISWDAENYPDLTGYVVSESDGRQDLVTPSEANCASSATCAISAPVGSDTAGSSYTFSVVAQRCEAPGSGCSTLSSTPSDSSAVTLPAATTTTGNGNGNGNGNNGNGNGSGSKLPTAQGSSGPKAVDGIGNNGFTKSGQLKAYTPTGGTDLPSANLPGLNLPSAALPGGEGAGSQALPQGTYKPTLAYPSQSSKSGSDTASGSSVTTAFVNVFNNSSFWRALALASVLLLAGSHLLVWLRRVPIEA